MDFDQQMKQFGPEVIYDVMGLFGMFFRNDLLDIHTGVSTGQSGQTLIRITTVVRYYGGANRQMGGGGVSCYWLLFPWTKPYTLIDLYQRGQPTSIHPLI